MIKFYRPNIMDLSNVNATITVTDAIASNNGQQFTDFLRNRKNTSGWATTDSTDAANTELLFNFNDLREFDSIMLVGHNFKSFLLEYNDGGTWDTLQDVTDNALTTNYYTYSPLIETDQIRLTIRATQVVDADKFMAQFIVTESIGTFSFEPELEAEISKERKASRYISGKSFVSSQVGGITVRARYAGAHFQADINLLQRLYDFFGGFLVSLSGGTTAQFENSVAPYRPQDLLYMQCSNEYEPNFGDGRFRNGLDMDLRLVETN